MKAYQLTGFKDIYESFKDKALPIKTAYKLNKLYKKVEEEFSTYQEMLIKLLRDCCEFDENGNIKYTEDGTSYKLKEDRIEECNTRISELNNLEVELPNIKFTLEELEILNLSVKEMDCLMPFIEE